MKVNGVFGTTKSVTLFFDLVLSPIPSFLRLHILASILNCTAGRFMEQSTGLPSAKLVSIVSNNFHFIITKTKLLSPSILSIAFPQYMNTIWKCYQFCTTY